MRIIYCCQHEANLLRAIFHKFKYHFNDEAVIIVDQKESNAYIDRYKNIRVCTCDPDYITRLVTKCDSKFQLFNDLIKFCDDYYGEHDIVISNFDRRYIFFDLYNIWSIYFNINKISYSIVEFMDNQLYNYSRPDFLNMLSPDSKLKNFYRFSNVMNMVNLNNNIVNTIYYFSNRSKIVCTDKDYKIFNFEDLLIDYCSSYSKDLSIIFKIDSSIFSKNIVFLTKSINYSYDLLKNNKNVILKKNNGVIFRSEDIVSEFYIKVIDYYYSKDKFLLKLHPCSGQLEDYFSEFTKIPKSIPFEIICNRFDLIISPLDTTSIRAARIFNTKIESFGNDLCRFSECFEYCYAVLSLIYNLCKQLNIKEINLVPLDINIKQLNEFINRLFNHNININVSKLPNIHLTGNSPVVFLSNSKKIDDSLSFDFDTIIFSHDKDAAANNNIFYRLEYAVYEHDKNHNFHIYDKFFIISKNFQHINVLDNFYVEWDLKYSNKSYFAQRQFLDSNSEYQSIFRICSKFEIYIKTQELALLSQLKNCTDFYNYINFLRLFRHKYLIVFSVCNVPGDCIPISVLENIRLLGFKNFSKQLFSMFIGIIDNNEIIADMSNGPKKSIETEYNDKTRNFKLFVSSHFWNGVGGANKSEIILNGNNLSINKRGVNIVVYDINNKILIDSICFDYHRDFLYYR